MSKHSNLLDCRKHLSSMTVENDLESVLSYTMNKTKHVVACPPHPTILAQQGGRSYRIMLKLTYFWSLLPQRNKCNYFLFWGSTYFIMWDTCRLCTFNSYSKWGSKNCKYIFPLCNLVQFFINRAESNLKDYNDASLCTNDDSGHKPLIQTHRNTAQKKKHKETFSFHFPSYHMVGCGQMFRVHRVLCTPQNEECTVFIPSCSTHGTCNTVKWPPTCIMHFTSVQAISW